MIDDKAQRQKNEGALELLRSWEDATEEEIQEQKDAWQYLRRVLLGENQPGPIGTDAAHEMLLRMTPGQNWDTPVMNGDEMAAGVKPGEGQLLYGLVRALCPVNVLEWGTGYGFSTIHLAAAMRDNARGMIELEPRIARTTDQVHTVEINTERRRQAYQNVCDAELLEWARFYGSMPSSSRRYGFVLLDAGHTAAEVAEYLDQVKPLLTPEAVVAVHDGCWQNHAREAAGDDWNIIEMPTTSTGGLVLMTLRGEA